MNNGTVIMVESIESKKSERRQQSESYTKRQNLENESEINGIKE